MGIASQANGTAIFFKIMLKLKMKMRQLNLQKII